MAFLLVHAEDSGRDVFRQLRIKPAHPVASDREIRRMKRVFPHEFQHLTINNEPHTAGQETGAQARQGNEKISRSDAAHNASVSSIDAVRVHDLRIMVAHRFRSLQK
jgi:hypothetical protein